MTDFKKTIITIKSKETETPEKIISKIVDKFKISAIENNDLTQSSLLLIHDNNQINFPPISLSMLHSGMGQMIMNPLIKSINDNKDCSNINSIVELFFGSGIVKKVKTEAEAKAKLQSLVDNKENLLSDPDTEDYLMCQISNKEDITLNIYGIIHITDKNGDPTGEGFAISKKPIVSKKLCYGTQGSRNYFK